MRSHRPLTGLTLGVLICVGSAGCAVNSSIALRGPGRRSDTVAPQRLLAIAKVFEQQGHLDRAASMYERVLAHDPTSIQARNAIANIESMNRPRDFRGTQPAASEVRGETLLADSTDYSKQNIHVVEDIPSSPVPESPIVIQPEMPIAVSGVLKLPPVPPATSIEVASSVVGTAVETSTQAVTAVGSVLDLTVPANRLVSLEEVRNQTASAARTMAGLPDEAHSNMSVLLRVLNESDDPERRAVAAALLADSPANEARVDSALEQHCLNDTALVSSSACESLLARGLVSGQIIRTLLSLSEHPDAGVRNQVCGSLRRLADTPWEDDAVHASLIRLDDTSPTVRGMAALTLSEFPGRSELILKRLVERYDLETDESVRGSLELAAERIASVGIDEGIPLPFAE